MFVIPVSTICRLINYDAAFSYRYQIKRYILQEAATVKNLHILRSPIRTIHHFTVLD